MANKRDSSRQKRARQNRAQRAALEARTKGTPPVRPSRVAPSTAEKLRAAAEERPNSTDTGSSNRSSKDAGGEKAATEGKDKSQKRKRERPPRPGDTPVDVETLEGGWFSRMTHVPGGTQALFAGVMAIMATGLVTFTKVFISEADEARFGKDAKASQTLFEAYDVGVALPLVGVPLLVALLAVRFSFHPQRRRIWLGAATVLALLSLLVAAALSYYLFVAGFFAYAVFRASRVEGPNKPLIQELIDRRRARRQPDADEFDEVEALDDEDVSVDDG